MRSLNLRLQNVPSPPIWGSAGSAREVIGRAQIPRGVSSYPDVLDYAKSLFSNTYTSRLDTHTLIALGVCDTNATRIVTGFKTRSDCTKIRDDLFIIIENLMPTRSKNPSLEKLFLAFL